MSVITLRDTDPQGNLSATPDQSTGLDDVMNMISGVMKLVRKRQAQGQQNSFKKAAADELAKGTGEAEYEFDPKTGQYRMKVTPKKPDTAGLNAQISRYRTAQQFGVDPVTGAPLREDQLKKPRFGYTGDLISQLFGGNANAINDVASDGDVVAPAPKKQGLNLMPTAEASDLPTNAGVNTGSATGGAPQFLSPQEHYNQLRAIGYTQEDARRIAGV